MKRTITFLVLLGGLLATMPSVQATHDPNDFFVTEATFPGITWYDIHGTSATNIFAIGIQGGVVRIASRSTGAWALQTIPAVTGSDTDRLSIWVASTTAAYATFGATEALKWNGVTWSTLAAPAGFEFETVWGASATNVIFGGNDGATLPSVARWAKYDGTTFTNQIACNQAGDGIYNVRGPFTNGEFRGISSTSAGTRIDFILNPAITCSIGNALNPLIRHGWVAPGTNTQFCVGGETNSPVGITDACDALAPTSNPASRLLNDVSGISATEVWAVGPADIIRYDGTSWTLEPITQSFNRHGVWCVSSSECWVVGSDGIIQKLQVNPAVGLPGIAIAEIHEDDTFEVTVSEGQCLGDKTSFNYNLELGSALITVSDLDAYIIDQDTPGSTFIQVDDSAMNTIGSRAFFHDEVLPVGPYIVLVKVDLTGVGSADFWDAEAFTVQDSCRDSPTDLSQVLNHIQYNQAQENVTLENVTHVHAEIHNQATITNARINATYTSTYSLINLVFSRLNTTCQKTEFSAAGCEGVENLCSEAGCNITVDNSDVITAMGEAEMKFIGYTTAESWTLLFIVALMIWAMYREWWWAFGCMALATLGVLLRINDYNLPVVVFLILLGFGLQFMANKSARRAEERQHAEANGDL